MKEDHQFLFIDFEFTMPDKSEAFRGFYPEIIEVGIVAIRNQRIHKKYSSFVKPVRFPVLSERCKSFLQITQEQVNSGIEFSELVKIFEDLCSEAPKNTVVTWGNMDMKVLRDNCEKLGFSYPLKGKEIDLSMEYKRFFGERNQTGLWKVVQEYGKEGVGQHHRALDDALTTYRIYRLIEKDKKYMEKPKPTTIGDLVDFSELINKYA